MSSSHHRHSSTTHIGKFLHRLPFLEGTSLILSGTIGAGILGLPYAIAQVGVGLGILCVFLVGALMLGLNMLIAEVAVSIRRPMQLVGLSKQYLGRGGEILMLVIMYTMLFGVLLVYLIGAGESLFALFGVNQSLWTVIFFLVATAFVIVGMKTIKFVEMILMVCLLAVVGMIVGVGIPHTKISNFSYFQPQNILVLYSVLMFAFHATTAIPEAHSVLKEKNKVFKKSIVAASLVCIVLYSLFSLSVVGVTGLSTTPIATIGLGFSVGPVIQVLANLFAIFAMGTGFLMSASALRDSLKWDFEFPHVPASLFVCTVPLLLYFVGVRQFILVMDVVGGVLISLEMLLLIVIYWRARHLGHLVKRGRFLHHALLTSSVVFAALLFGTIYNVVKYF